MKIKNIMVIILAAVMSLSAGVQAVTVTFHAAQPTPGTYDISNFVGATRDQNNVGTATADGAFNDATTYVAFDRGAQGQTFVTGSSKPVYQVTGIWVRHVGYTTQNTVATWYMMPNNSRFGIRITDPCASGTGGFVLSSETYIVTGSEPNKLPAANTSNVTGSGTWMHFVLATPVPVAPNRTYGFDVLGVRTTGFGADLFFEMHGVKDTSISPPGNPYTTGKAYTSGLNGSAGTTAIPAPGDRVFVVELLGEAPLIASVPYPDVNALGVPQTLNLTWVKGKNAAKHDVYFSTDKTKVTNASRSNPLGVLVSQNQDPNSYPLAGLVPGTTYYWRIDEVNNPTIWKGNVWGFTVMPTKAWDPSPYDDEICVFDNPKPTLYWNAGYNSNQSKVYFGTNPAALPLKTTINHTSQTRYSYQVTDAINKDTYYYWRIDEVHPDTSTTTGDIWHFKTIPNIPVTDPTLVGWWKFDEGPGKAIDWSGLNQHGTAYGNPVSVSGYDVNAMQFDGSDDRVSLPIGTTISTLGSATIATWVNVSSTAAWQRIFDFGNNPGIGVPTVYMYLTPINGGGVPQFSITTTSGGGASNITAPYALSSGWHHLAVTLDENTSDMVLYIDAVPVSTASTTTLPSALGDTNDNNLGKSKYWDPPDPYFKGSLDDFRIYNYAMTQAEIKLVMAPYEAWLPNPADGATNVIWSPTLSWEAGKYAASVNGHKVYFDPDIAKVQARNGCDVNGVSTTNPSYTPGALEPFEALTTYYWAVDEVNGLNTWPGHTWRFTTRGIDTFESYTATGGIPPEAGTLRRTWIDGLWAAEWFEYPGGLKTPGSSGSYAQLNTDTADDATNTANIALGGTKSMKFYYDNDGTITWRVDLYNEDPYYTYTAPKYSEVSAAIDDAARLSSPNPPFDPNAQDSLGIGRDWSGYKLLRLPVYGDTANTLAVGEKLYVGLKDGDGTEVTIYNPDPNILKQPFWSNWYIPLADFPAQNANLDLTNIARIYIGVGVRGNNAFNGGRGSFFADSIELLPSICIPGNVTGDFTNDCTVNAADLQRMTELWLGQMPTMPTPVIQLDASGLALGTLSTWSNSGSAGGSFNDFNSLVPGDNPTVAMVDGKKVVVFDGNDILKATINAPASITGNKPFTVIYNVWNPDIGSDEEIFCWAKRGTNARYAAACYSSGTAWAAAALWGPADVGFDRSSPAARTWHTIALSYKGDVNQPFYVVTDGQINTSVIRNLNLWPNNPMTVGGAYDGDPDDANNPTITGGYFFSGSLAKLEVYNVYVPPGNLAILMGTPVDMKKDNVINFRDIAIFAKNWMLGPVLWP